VAEILGAEGGFGAGVALGVEVAGQAHVHRLVSPRAGEIAAGAAAGEEIADVADGVAFPSVHAEVDDGFVVEEEDVFDGRRESARGEAGLDFGDQLGAGLGAAVGDLGGHFAAVRSGAGEVWDAHVWWWCVRVGVVWNGEGRGAAAAGPRRAGWKRGEVAREVAGVAGFQQVRRIVPVEIGRADVARGFVVGEESHDGAGRRGAARGSRQQAAPPVA
jgi:hypothetical protein